jgi:hypothetical protein
MQRGVILVDKEYIREAPMKETVYANSDIKIIKIIGDYQAKAFSLQSTELPSTAKPTQVQQELIRQNLQGVITI